ncbi:MAG: hypothetical protein R6V14_07530 [Halanaerobiales bacterium]
MPDDVEEGDILDFVINRNLEEKERVEERIEGLIEKLKNRQN